MTNIIARLSCMSTCIYNTGGSHFHIYIYKGPQYPMKMGTQVPIFPWDWGPRDPNLIGGSPFSYDTCHPLWLKKFVALFLTLNPVVDSVHISLFAFASLARETASKLTSFLGCWLVSPRASKCTCAGATILECSSTFGATWSLLTCLQDLPFHTALLTINT